MKNHTDRIKNHKKYYKLKRSKAWVSVLMFFVVACLLGGFMVLQSETFLLFTVNSALGTEYDSKSALIILYEEGISSDDDPYYVFNKSGMDYIIRDESGSVIYSHGDTTFSGEGYSYTISIGKDAVDVPDGTVTGLPEESEKVTLYADDETKVLIPEDEDSIHIDIVRLFRLFSDSFTATDNKDTKGDDVVIKNISMPIWEAIKLDNGQELVFKAYISLRNTDIVLAVILVLSMLLVLLVVLIALIIHAVAEAVRQRRINKMFYTDMKVGGHNWLWFMYRSEQALRKIRNAKKKYALVDIEFVDYRRFCTCHSVDEGEAMLRGIYDRISSLIGKKELCAHSAENSFALMLDMNDEQTVMDRVKAILDELGRIEEAHRFRYHAGIFPINETEGSGIFLRRKNVDTERDYNSACTACASLAESGESGAVMFDDKLVEEQRWIDTVTEAQQKALENEEFKVYYQPKYDPKTNELRGAEALIRWVSPVYGFITPYKFIPIFEKSGFITEIDHYMIAHAARDQRRWLDMGLKCVPVSVNVSRAHFIESDLAEQIRDLVDREGTPHELIEIELTESAFFDDKEAMINTISRLKSYGFSVSMDDFGSGYSSLNSLKDMQLDVLKLDAEFFRGEAAGTDRGEIVVSEAIKLAKSLNMRTVAEGVEIKEQVEFLAKQDCDMIQGYYFAKPMPGEEYEQRMDAAD